ncbi:MAG: DUF4160 domain-containing protein [Planctomycetaceae bacterium]|nr:DUF4160 domain-containing protein [Planctomycetota bacterium]NUN53652.1 DUF4160 domain-containing protein [Planctomycetaceae bacterium]
MPTVPGTGPWRVRFFGNDRNEPPHMHVDRDEATAKFWIGPVSLARNRGFRNRELREIMRMLEDQEPVLLEAWHGFFE